MRRFLLIVLVSVCALSAKAQFAAMFWNVENLFDTTHDTLKLDSEFMPESVRAWNRRKFHRKIQQVAKVVATAHGWDPPVLVGLCEVENEYVMRSLVDYGPLAQLGYRFVMTQSDDVRGIDVALMYRRDRFKLIGCQRVHVDIEGRPTRDILHVSGRLIDRDTLDVMVVHLPSKLGGRLAEKNRCKVAGRVRSLSDSICAVRRRPRVLVMGDFNDTPEGRAVSEVLEAFPPSGEVNEYTLYHLLSRRVKGKDKGSYKYQGRWELIDHILVSGRLLDASSGFYTSEEKADILRLPFLLVPDEQFGGEKPHRTYHGMRYQGGYSDHLPVLVEFAESDEPR